MSGRSPLRVLLVTQYYPPEVGAPQTRLHETARALTDLGLAVRVMTAPPHYPDGRVRQGYTWWRPSRERIDGIPILRVPMIPRRNGGFVERTIDQGSFAAAAIGASAAARWADVLVVESPPLFLAAGARLIRGLSGRPYLLHVADPWPDVAIETGALRDPRAIRMAFALERAAYRGASLITTVSPGLVERLDRKPGAGGKVRLLPNAVDTRRFDPLAQRADARASLGWNRDSLTLVYAGSAGRAHGLSTLLDAARRLEAEDASIVVVGGGLEREVLRTQAEAAHIPGLRFLDPVPAERVPTLLAAADGVVVMQRGDEIYRHFIPTKLVEGLAAGRPILISAGGDAARVVSDAGAGLVARPDDGEALAAAIRSLRDLPDAARETMGTAGRALAESRYDRRAVVARLAGYLEEATGR